MFLMLLGLSIANTAMSNYRRSIARIDAAQDQTIFFMKILGGLTPESFEGPGYPGLKQYLDYIRQVAGLTYAAVMDQNGEFIFISAEPGTQEEIESALLKSGPSSAGHGFPAHITVEGVKNINSAITLPGNENLLLNYGIKTRGTIQQMSEEFLSDDLASVISLVLVLISGLAYIGTVVSPIAKMTEYATRIAEHDFTAILDIRENSGDIGSLALAMRRMAGELSNSIVDLKAEVKEATDKKSAALDQLDTIISNLNEGLLVMDIRGLILQCNSTAAEILGQPVTPVGKYLINLVHASGYGKEDSTAPGQFLILMNSLGLDQDHSVEIAMEDRLPDKKLRYLEISVSYKSIQGEKLVICVFRDVSARRQVENELRKSHEYLEQAVEERTGELKRANARLKQENVERKSIERALIRAESRYREIVDNAIEGIFQRATDGRMISANPALARILGYDSVDELLSRFMDAEQRLCYTAEMEHSLVELLEMRGRVSNLEFQACMQDGSPVWVSINARRVTDTNGDTLYYEAFLEDITSRKETEEKLLYQAYHDPLTSLPNRALFLDRLKMAMIKAKRHADYKFAVLYLDLDRFKNINDSLGHSAGDEVLNQATAKLLMCVREADTVARFGGDEFAILLDDLIRPAQAVHITRRISQTLEVPMFFMGQELRIKASIGIVLSNGEYSTPDEILRDADTAMYRAKSNNKRSYLVFNARMREETLATLALENALHGAVERGELMAYYQPLVELGTGRVYGFEALMRWQYKGQMISPAVFIPIAEDTGVINPIGLHMLRIVCDQLVRWNKQGINHPVVHVNISGKQLMSSRFSRDVQEVLEVTGADPKQLIFEITESVFLDYGSQVVSMMSKLRELGIRFCLDDFGTGFSSLSYLRMLPLESLKLDRSFIVDLEKDLYSVAILRNLVSMGYDIGLNVIIEGVDQESQVSRLLSVGCRYAQGFYFARPMPADQAMAFLQASGHRYDAFLSDHS